MGIHSPKEGGRKEGRDSADKEKWIGLRSAKGKESKQKHHSGVGQSQSGLGRKSRRACVPTEISEKCCPSGVSTGTSGIS